LQTVDLVLDFVDRAESDTAAGSLLLVDARLELFVQTLDLAELLGATRLARLLCLADLVQSCAQLLLSLGLGGLLVVGTRVELGLD
jgi:hypothetical protein